MKVTATGVSEGTAMEMFRVWQVGLRDTESRGDRIDVRFVLETEDVRT